MWRRRGKRRRQALQPHRSPTPPKKPRAQGRTYSSRRVPPPSTLTLTLTRCVLPSWLSGKLDLVLYFVLSDTVCFFTRSLTLAESAACTPCAHPPPHDDGDKTVPAPVAETPAEAQEEDTEAKAETAAAEAGEVAAEVPPTEADVPTVRYVASDEPSAPLPGSRGNVGVIRGKPPKNIHRKSTSPPPHIVVREEEGGLRDIFILQSRI